MIRRMRFLFTLLSLALGGVSFADSLKLAQMDHVAWTAREGAPVDVFQFAQDPDGSLWILSTSGLYDFDGDKFSLFSTPSPKPTVSFSFLRSMLMDNEGCLWIGSEIRGIAQICDRKLSNFYDESDGLLAGQVKQILRSPDGTMLAIAKDHLLELHAGRWRELGPANGLPNESVAGAFFDHSGRLFVMADKSIWLQESTRGNFRKLTTPGGIWGGFSERPDHSVWAITNLPDRKLAYIEQVSPAANAPAARRIEVAASEFLSDDRGALWIAADKGVARADLQGQTPALEVLTHVDGLSSDSVTTVFQDRSGNIWAGTSAGIDRFRATPLVRFIDRELPLTPHITACPSGEVWVTSSQMPPFSIRAGVVADHGPPRSAAAIYCDANDVIWLTDPQGFFRYDGADIRAIALPPGTNPQFLRKAEGDQSNLFVAITRQGLWSYRNGTWSRFTAAGVPEITPISLYQDRQHRIWAGFIDSRIAVIQGTEGHTYDSGRSPLGEVEAFCESRAGLLAGGTNGLAIFRGDHFDSLALKDSGAARGVSGLLEAANGDLWLNGLHGIVRIPAQEVGTALRSPSYRMRSETLHEAGMSGPAPQMIGLPSAVADSEGRFWFSSAAGLYSLDPLAAIKNAELPKLGRLSLNVDAQESASGAKIPHGEHTVRIRYQGVFLSAPERVSYRYKLEGLDTKWQDVGARTEAVYTSLSPGKYRFRVVASSGYDGWTPQDDSIAFSVLPAFYQTLWFAVVCVALVLLTFWALVRLRTHRLALQIRRHAEERADERIRIARDLHDTLLQGVQGLMLRFHAAAQAVSADGAAQRRLDEALKAADQVIVEARDRVSRLRTDANQDMDLAARFKSIGENLNRDESVRFSLTVEGSPAVLSPQTVDELYFIGREALTNAFRHSDASAIVVTITYARSEAIFRFTDNGRGFHPAAQASQDRSHWGMSGMMERAHRIGAKFECESHPGSGTSIVISVSMGNLKLHFFIRAFLGMFRRSSGS
jgi:signal transduction histidine kinase/ligand-binding sensor domain-containing protein